MYLIKLVDFNILENTLKAATSISDVGVLNGSKDDAEKWIEINNPKKQYKGWDGNMYPYYIYTPIVELTID